MNQNIRKGIIIWSIVNLLLVFVGVSIVQADQKTIILATTTSTQDSGLLDVLIPIFENRNEDIEKS